MLRKLEVLSVKTDVLRRTSALPECTVESEPYRHDWASILGANLGRMIPLLRIKAVKNLVITPNDRGMFYAINTCMNSKYGLTLLIHVYKMNFRHMHMRHWKSNDNH